MAEMDFVQPKQEVSKTLVYNQKDLYKYLMKWFAARHYAVVELAYKEKELSPGTKEYSFDWANEKKIEDYTKLFIEVGFQAVATDVVIETTEGKRKAQKGDVKVEFKAYVSKDVEDDYTLTADAPQRRLLREFYEQFIIKRKMARFEEQLKTDLKAIITDLKTYLKTHRYD